MKTLPLVIALLLAIPAAAFAIDSRMTDSAEFDVEQRGSVSVSGTAISLNIFLYIPQDDGTQTTRIREVGDSSGICMLTSKSFEGLCSYQIIYDQLGNQQVKITSKNPGNFFTFYVKSSVSVKRAPYLPESLGSTFLKATDTIQTYNPEIVRKASEITSGKADGFDKVAAMTEWVHEKIKYDTSYTDRVNPANLTLTERRGACDELSILLASMARALGYQTSYVAGYALGKGELGSEFISHGWNEVTVGNRTYTVDSTWAEIPADATHIKFARLAGSNFAEVSVTAGSRAASEVSINPMVVIVNVTGSKEKPLISSSSRLLADRLSQGYVVVRSDLAYDGCMLGELSVQGCSFGSTSFLEALTGDRTVSFCEKRSVFSIFKLPDLENGMSYNCPITVLSPMGDEESVNVSMSASYPAPPSLAMSISKTNAKIGDPVRVSASGAELFTSDGQYASGSGDFNAINSMNVYAYKDGALAEQSVFVSADVPLDVEIISSQSAEAGQRTGVAVKVTNVAGSELPVTVRLANQSDTKTIAAGGSAIFDFTFVPQGAEDNAITAYVSSGSFLTSSSKAIDVTESDWLGSLIASISDFFSKMFGGAA